MQGPTALFLPSIWTLFFVASRFYHVAAYTPSPFFPQSFTFDWNPPGTALPIPITEQCETLQITWERGTTSAGPSPVSPYFLQVFTSIYSVPIIIPVGSGNSFDFQVPFNPGTQYQICMVDSRGNAGGCQDIYTVVPNSTFTAQNPANCTNVTLPTNSLQVDANVITGALTQFAWIPQCTDIEVQGMNGTGPYTLTVAPTLHPPLNITSDSGPINWTVSFTDGFPFFIALTDSQGNSWSQGPLHSDNYANTSCLDTSHLGSTGHKSPTIPAAIGAGVGGIVVGLLAGAFGIFAFRRSRSGKKHRADLVPDSPLSSENRPQSREIPAPGLTTNMATGGLGYVEPFAMPPGTPLSPTSGSGNPLSYGGGVTSLATMSRADAMSTSGSSEPATRNVYVVHHDGGHAPVSVFTDGGADVVELPPRYAAGSTSTPSETSSTDVMRRGGSTRKKREPSRT
ncbi:hypothetical protein BGY98DRAFT_1092372 [Russula aff. rugulosa BPL654]|nr:hypothetical protein BGY98DRAFT_1092372 [Russula aff. rugulosa BPL654]